MPVEDEVSDIKEIPQVILDAYGECLLHNNIKRNRSDMCLAEMQEKFTLFIATTMGDLADDYFHAGRDSLIATNQLRALRKIFKFSPNVVSTSQRLQRVEEEEYVSGLLLNRPKIARVWQEERGKIYEIAKKFTPSDQVARIKTSAQIALNQDNSLEIPSDVWLPMIYDEADDKQIQKELFEAPIVNPTRIEEITNKDTDDPIDIEAFFIDAIETLHYLRHHANNDAKTLDMVMKAESFLAPVMENIGFERLAMALNSEAKKIRIRNGGYGEFIHLAEREITAVGDAEKVASELNEILGELIGKSDLELPNLDDSTGEEILFGRGHASFVLNGDEIQLRLRYRRKTIGSLAWKKLSAAIERSHKVSTGRMAQTEAETDALKPEMDLVAVTAIAHHEMDLERAVEQVTQNEIVAQSFGLLQLNPSPSRKSAFHVRGTKDFRQKFSSVIKRLGVDNIDIHPETSPKRMHIVKSTFFNKLAQDGSCTPTEIQMVTQKYRRLMRVGEISHLGYKAGADESETSNWSESLKTNRSRGHRMHIPELLPKNKTLAERFLAEIFGADKKLLCGATGGVAVELAQVIADFNLR